MVRRVIAVDGVLRRYDWGSRTAIPALLDIEPDGRPAAELWFGAHPDDPSPVPGHGRALDEVIANDPVAMLGADVVARFGARLPFLMKVLAVEKALSIQVHPTLAQAQQGFAAEDAAGIAHDAPNRNYRDANHKPELLCALTEFDALCGFRPVTATLALLDDLAVPELGFLAELLRRPDPLRAAFTALVTKADLAPAVSAVSARARPDGPLRGPWLAAQHFPVDIGIVVAVLLNHVRLRPGEAIYLGAGTVHAYLRGTGVEIMANSDNVLRCGLTPKHIDVPELLRITNFTELAEPRVSSSPHGFVAQVPDFRLVALQVDATVSVPGDGPRIVLCAQGSVSAGTHPLRPGHAVFVAAGQRCDLDGVGQVFVATVGVLPMSA